MLPGKLVQVKRGVLDWSCACGAAARARLFLLPFWFGTSLLYADVDSDFPSLSFAGCTQLLDESQVTLSFQDWLASVTERIHQTMHYQFEGKASRTTSGEPLGLSPLCSVRHLCH